MSDLRMRTYFSPNYEGLYRYMAGQIAAELGCSVDFEVGTTFEEFLASPTDLALGCGLWYVQNSQVYEPLAAPIMAASRYASEPVYFVDVTTVAGKQLPAPGLAGLEGLVFGFNEHQSLSGYHAFVTELARQHYTLDFLGSVVETGSHLNSIKSLLAGKIDFAAFDSTVLEFEMNRRPELAEQLQLVTSLGPYAAPPLMVNQAVENSVKAQILKIVTNLPSAQLASYGVASFGAVEPDFYRPMAALFALHLTTAQIQA